MTITQSMFEAIIHADDGDQARQAKATRVGFKIQHQAAKILATHPAVARVEQEHFDASVDEFSNIDIVLHLHNGQKFYVPVAKDIWIGTSQQDRLQVIYLKDKLGIFDKINYLYLYFSEDKYQELMAWTSKRRNARRGFTIQSTVKNLKDKGLLGNIEDLWNRLDSMV